MKKILLLLSVLFIGQTAFAQLATPEEIGEMLGKGQNVEAVKAATALYKKNKKNPDIICAIARQFLANKDLDGATDFALKAQEASKNKSAAAHLILGDIWYTKDDAGNATQEYLQAIELDPKDPAAYIKYANVYKDKFPDEAVAKLEALAVERPDLDVNLLIGRCMSKGNHMKRAVLAFDKCNKDVMGIDDISDYAFAAFMSGDSQKALNLADFGAAKNDTASVFPRLRLYALTSLGENEKAVEASKTLFATIGSNKPNFLDYQFLGSALNGLGKNAEAIDAFRQAYKVAPERHEILTKVAASYSLMKDFDSAVSTMNEYFSIVGADAETFDNYSTVGDIYMAKARALEETDTIAMQTAVEAAFEAYDKAIAKKPNSFLGYYNKGVAQYAFHNPAGALESFGKAAEIIEASGVNKPYLKAAYSYMGNCHKKLGDVETGKEYQAKADAIQ
ncbi:MAG: hypothetical protein MJY52_04125 [Bacteroidaceae bacterium]|nr:hypothetical protein [Bacteroidaceae bacterium]